MIGVSGVRGIVGEDLDPELVAKFAAAFGQFLAGGLVVVGSDTRPSNEMFRYALFAGLLSTGCEVVDLGICPTPSLQLMVTGLEAKGGIAITGSHNPAQWNALKFVRPDGLFLYPEQIQKVLGITERRIKRVSWDRIGKVRQEDSAIENHLKKILPLVDQQEIRDRHFKVVIDGCNGAGALITPELLQRLGCEVVKINCEPHGYFAHPPEPTRSNLKELSQIVESEKADIGISHDADADRVGLVTEKGDILPEDYVLLLAAKFILGKKKGLVVTNLSTTQALDDLAADFDSRVRRTKVGDVYVARCMRKEKAVIGGEGNGGVIVPEVQYARDGIAAVALILNYLAQTGSSLSLLASSLPRYYMVKRKVKIPPKGFPPPREYLKKQFRAARFNFLDGVKITLKEGWIHLRSSGTEPVVRIISEARTRQEAENLCRIGMEKVLERSTRSMPFPLSSTTILSFFI